MVVYLPAFDKSRFQVFTKALFGSGGGGKVGIIV